MSKLVYIAGPMRGRPNWNYPIFNHYAALYRQAGWHVINPVDIGNLFGSPSYLEANPRILKLVMDIELCCVARCDAIFLIDGWETSDGARNELQVALNRRLIILSSKEAQFP